MMSKQVNGGGGGGVTGAPTHRCHLCGCSSPAVRCEKCSNLIFCLSCDDMYHRHPKRHDHLRKLVNVAPMPPPRPPPKSLDPRQAPIPPPRRKKPELATRPPIDKKPDLPKKQFPLKFGSLKRFIPGGSSHKPEEQSQRKDSTVSGVSYPSNEVGYKSESRSSSFNSGSSRSGRQYEMTAAAATAADRHFQPLTRPQQQQQQHHFVPASQHNSNYLGGYADQDGEQSASDVDEELGSQGSDRGSYTGSVSREVVWGEPGHPVDPRLPPPYMSQAHHSPMVYPINSYPTAGQDNRQMNFGYRKQNLKQHSNSVCDLSGQLFQSMPIGYTMPQHVQSMADIHMMQTGGMMTPSLCGCRPDWIGPDAYGLWHPPVHCPIHSSAMQLLPAQTKPHAGAASGYLPTNAAYRETAPPTAYARPYCPSPAAPPMRPPSISEHRFRPEASPSPAPPGGAKWTATPPPPTDNSYFERGDKPETDKNHCDHCGKNQTNSASPEVNHQHHHHHHQQPHHHHQQQQQQHNDFVSRISRNSVDREPNNTTTTTTTNSTTSSSSNATNGAKANSKAPISWQCRHCTFFNVPGTKICAICCKTTGIGDSSHDLSDENLAEVEPEARNVSPAAHRLDRRDSPNFQTAENNESTEVSPPNVKEQQQHSNSNGHSTVSTNGVAVRETAVVMQGKVAAGSGPYGSIKRLDSNLSVLLARKKQMKDDEVYEDLEQKNNINSKSDISQNNVKRIEPNMSNNNRRLSNFSQQTESKESQEGKVSPPHEKGQVEVSTEKNSTSTGTSTGTSPSNYALNGRSTTSDNTFEAKNTKLAYTATHRNNNIPLTSSAPRVVSQGTSPPPQNMSTQTSRSCSPDPLLNDVPLMEPEQFMRRVSSQMSISAAVATATAKPANKQPRFFNHHTKYQAGPLKRAASLHFGATAPTHDSPWANARDTPISRAPSCTSLAGDYKFGMDSSPDFRDIDSPPRGSFFDSESPFTQRYSMESQFGQRKNSLIDGQRNTRKDYYLSLEELIEKRRQATIKAQGLELVNLLREAEKYNFSADDLQVAINHCGTQNPVKWLQDNWRNMLDTVVTLATNYGHDKKENDIGIISNAEAKECLHLHKGNIWAAVTECVEQRQRKFMELQRNGQFCREEVVAALTANQGNVNDALADLNKSTLKPFLMRIWGPPVGVDNEDGVSWERLNRERDRRISRTSSPSVKDLHQYIQEKTNLDRQTLDNSPIFQNHHHQQQVGGGHPKSEPNLEHIDYEESTYYPSSERGDDFELVEFGKVESIEVLEQPLAEITPDREEPIKSHSVLSMINSYEDLNVSSTTASEGREDIYYDALAEDDDGDTNGEYPAIRRYSYPSASPTPDNQFDGGNDLQRDTMQVSNEDRAEVVSAHAQIPATSEFDNIYQHGAPIVQSSTSAASSRDNQSERENDLSRDTIVPNKVSTAAATTPATIAPIGFSNIYQQSTNIVKSLIKACAPAAKSDPATVVAPPTANNAQINSATPVVKNERATVVQQFIKSEQPATAWRNSNPEIISSHINNEQNAKDLPSVSTKITSEKPATASKTVTSDQPTAVLKTNTNEKTSTVSKTNTNVKPAVASKTVVSGKQSVVPQNAKNEKPSAAQSKIKNQKPNLVPSKPSVLPSNINNQKQSLAPPSIKKEKPTVVPKIVKNEQKSTIPQVTKNEKASVAPQLNKAQTASEKPTAAVTKTVNGKQTTTQTEAKKSSAVSPISKTQLTSVVPKADTNKLSSNLTENKDLPTTNARDFLQLNSNTIKDTHQDPETIFLNESPVVTINSPNPVVAQSSAQQRLNQMTQNLELFLGKPLDVRAATERSNSISSSRPLLLNNDMEIYNKYTELSNDRQEQSNNEIISNDSIEISNDLLAGQHFDPTELSYESSEQSYNSTEQPNDSTDLLNDSTEEIDYQEEQQIDYQEEQQIDYQEEHNEYHEQQSNDQEGQTNDKRNTLNDSTEQEELSDYQEQSDYQDEQSDYQEEQSDYQEQQSDYQEDQSDYLEEEKLNQEQLNNREELFNNEEEQFNNQEEQFNNQEEQFNNQEEQFNNQEEQLDDQEQINYHEQQNDHEQLNDQKHTSDEEEQQSNGQIFALNDVIKQIDYIEEQIDFIEEQSNNQEEEINDQKEQIKAELSVDLHEPQNKLPEHSHELLGFQQQQIETSKNLEKLQDEPTQLIEIQNERAGPPNEPIERKNEHIELPNTSTTLSLESFTTSDNTATSSNLLSTKVSSVQKKVSNQPKKLSNVPKTLSNVPKTSSNVPKTSSNVPKTVSNELNKSNAPNKSTEVTNKRDIVPQKLSQMPNPPEDLSNKPSDTSSEKTIPKDEQSQIAANNSQKNPKIDSAVAQLQSNYNKSSTIGNDKVVLPDSLGKTTQSEQKSKNNGTERSLLSQHPLLANVQTTFSASSKNVMPASKENDTNRLVRKLLAEGKLPSYEQAEVAAKLMDLMFEENDAIYAAQECASLYMAVSYLQQDCELCAGRFPMSKMISMLNCVHRCCIACATDYFTLKIKEGSILDAVCPFCNEPNLRDETAAPDYFNNLDILLKNLVKKDVHELYQRKLRDLALMNDPNFRWCNKCSSGFIADPQRKRLMCPDCKDITCAVCKKPWEHQHEGITCAQFSEWKNSNDPEHQIIGLEKYLAENGIDCPKCKFKYDLAKGGCMHFTCTQCKFEFCSGCGKPFRMAKKCGLTERCEKLGLHAHHPRNCLFYLRDKDPKNLQDLLQKHGVQFDTEAQSSADSGNKRVQCPVLEQKEMLDGNVDAICGRDVEAGHAGLCLTHWLEYLGGLVWQHNLDTIELLSEDDLENLLKGAGHHLPPRPYGTVLEEYLGDLKQYVLEDLPLT